MVVKTKTLAIITLFLTLFLFLTLGFSIYQKEKQMTINQRGYGAEILMHTSPSMESRVPTERDIDTKLNVQTTDGKVYHLYESRDPQDFFNYGKTFVVRVK